MIARRPRRTGWSARTWVVVAIVVVAAMACGFLASRALAPDRPATSSPAVPHTAVARSAALGPLRLQPDPSWARVAHPPAVPGFAGRPALAFSPYPGLQTVVLAATGPAVGPTLLPMGLSAGGRKPSAGHLAGVPVWYYRRLSAGPWHLDAAVLPTTRGIVTVACAVRGGEVPLGCLDDVRAVGIAGAQPVPPGPEVALLMRLPGVVQGLNTARVQGRAALRRGATPRAQAVAAARLRVVHAAAASVMAPVAGGSAVGTRLVRALRATAAGYGALERAARRHDPKGWLRARRPVRRAELGLRRALAAVRRDPAAAALRGESGS